MQSFIIFLFSYYTIEQSDQSKLTRRVRGVDSIVPALLVRGVDEIELVITERSFNRGVGLTGGGSSKFSISSACVNFRI